MFDLNPQFSNNSRHRFNGDVQSRLETMEEDSGVCSPPLWERTVSNSPSDSPVRFTNPRALSPASRARAIAKGRHEMMEMVENMSETCYELSLKDIVEKRREFNVVEETQSMEEGEERSILTESQKKNKKKYDSNKKTGAGRSIVKNSSMNHNNNNKGLLINMFFPFSIGSKKRKSSNSSSGVKFSPKPELLNRRDWLRKKFTDSGDSESLGITSSSSSSTDRSGSSGSSGSSVAGSLRSNGHGTKTNCSYGCWSFFPSRRKIL